MDTIVPINAGIVLTTRLTLMRPLMQIKNGGTTQLAPITATNDEIREALTSAHLAPLMLTIAHLTGDMSILRGDIRPESAFLGPPDAGISDEQGRTIRERAFDVISAWRDNPGDLHELSDDELEEMISFLIQREELAEIYTPFLRAEFSSTGEDPFAQPAIEAVPEATRANYHALVIGAGMSGLLAGIRLKEAGIPFTIVEKNPGVGGTWFENTYPGCRVDSANHVYSYSFKPKDWPQHFSPQAVLREYFEECADEFDLYGSIRFETEVTEARFDGASRKWQITVSHDGESETIVADAMISAVGQLNRPKLPDIDGAGTFDGPQFHSAEWDHSVDLTGKRVGVIGSGASAFQFVPIISEQAADVTVFQRTAPWVVPSPDYFKDVPAGKHWLLNHVPTYAKWFRFSMFWRSAEGLMEGVAVDEGWNKPEVSVGQQNDVLREMLVGNLKAHFEDHPDLLEKCTPNYPPGAKRALVDDGKWLTTLKKDNVHLLTDPIANVNAGGIATQDGTQHDFDVIVYATGFRASTFLFPIDIYGANGEELHEHWGVDPRAYKGITTPGYPNLFFCYGPNTNIVVNGSIVFFSECEIRYILGCLALAMEHGAALDVKQEVHDRYNEWIDDGTTKVAWGQSSVSTWYKNVNGRITQNWPFTQVEFWKMTREPDAADFDFV